MGYMGCKGEITFMILIPPQEYLSPTIARTPCRLSGDVRPGAEICGQGLWALGFLGLVCRHEGLGAKSRGHGVLQQRTTFLRISFRPTEYDLTKPGGAL